MIRQLKILLIAITIAALAGCATVPADRNIFDSALDGAWQGMIENETQTDILRLRLIIDGENASVWTDQDGIWVEEKHGFRVSRAMGNAVIHATYPGTISGTDDDSTDVVTWAIIATPRSPTELLVVSSWVENSSDMRMDTEFFRYSSHIAGVLYRSPNGR